MWPARKLSILVVAVLAGAAGSVSAYTYNPSDFATEVVEYVEGTGVGSDWLSGDKFNNSDCALGRPTVDSTGDGGFILIGDPVPVVPVYSASSAMMMLAPSSSLPLHRCIRSRYLSRGVCPRK